MMENFNIRKASTSDLETLMHLSWDTFYDSFYQQNTQENMKVYMDQAFHPTHLLKEIKNPWSSFFFLQIDASPIGYLKTNQAPAQSDLHDPASLEVERLYVESGYQGMGLGTLLLNKAKEQAKDQGLQYLWLGVWEKNTGAIRFYKRYGFTIFSSHPFVFGDEVQTDILMKYVL